MKHPNGMLDYMNLNTDKDYLMLELGSGTGIAGIGFAKQFLKSRCILTDYSESSIQLISDNIRDNNMSKDLVSGIKFEWGQENAKNLKE